jgi:hypothetical protein
MKQLQATVPLITGITCTLSALSIYSYFGRTQVTDRVLGMSRWTIRTLGLESGFVWFRTNSGLLVSGLVDAETLPR